MKTLLSALAADAASISSRSGFGIVKWKRLLGRTTAMVSWTTIATNVPFSKLGVSILRGHETVPVDRPFPNRHSVLMKSRKHYVARHEPSKVLEVERIGISDDGWTHLEGKDEVLVTIGSQTNIPYAKARASRNWFVILNRTFIVL